MPALRWLRLVAVFLLLSFAAGARPARAELRTLETEHFTISYDSSQEKIARTAAPIAEAAHARIAAFLSLPPQGKTSLVIAPDRRAFVEETEGRVPDWGVGVAIPAYRRIVITSPADAPARVDLEEILTHEIAHVLLRVAIPGGRYPRWFDEGHAMFHAREWRAAESTRIVWALLARNLIPLADLTYGFPADRVPAELAYTESFTAVEFLVRSKDPDSFRSLVRRAAILGDFESALIETYGWNLVTFEGAWKDYLGDRYPWAVIPGLLFSIPGVFVLLFLAAYLRKRIRAARRLSAWKEEEEPPAWVEKPPG
jgi:hypothetical protein